jgi:hypothetical protein
MNRPSMTPVSILLLKFINMKLYAPMFFWFLRPDVIVSIWYFAMISFNLLLVKQLLYLLQSLRLFFSFGGKLVIEFTSTEN